MEYSSNDLGFKNPLKEYGYANLSLASLLALLAVVAVASTGVTAGSTAISVGLIIAVGFHLYQGIHALVSFLVEANCPGPLLGGQEWVQKLMIRRTISHTYNKPTGLFAMTMVHLYPRLLFLSPSRRHILPGQFLWFLFFVATFVLPFVFGGWGLLIAFSVGLAILIRLAAIGQAVPLSPTTEHVVERKIHLGDKGDPIGLHEHAKRILEGYRIDSFQNRYIASAVPQISELGQNSRVESALICETQPRVRQEAPLSNETIITGLAALAFIFIGWLTTVITLSTMSDEPNQSAVAILLASLVAISCGMSLLLLTKGLLSTFRFESEIYFFAFNGSYNTTKVGLHRQRTSFQSDLYAEIYATKILSECSLLQSTDQEMSGVAPANVLHMPRYVLSTESNELFATRLTDFLNKINHYEDEGSHARVSSLDPAEVQQHIALAQLTQQAKVRGTQIALGQTPQADLLEPTNQPDSVSDVIANSPKSMSLNNSAPTQKNSDPAGTKRPKPNTNASNKATPRTSSIRKPPPPPPKKK